MNTQHIETLIIGAGQAGLATGYHLKRRGRPLLIVDANARIGDNWRQQWDTLRLYTPAKYDGLPGLPFPAAQLALPAEGRGRRLPGAVRAALRPSGADQHPGGPARGAAGRRVPRDRRRRGDQLRQRRGGHRHLRPDAERARSSPPNSTRRSGSCTPASTGGRPSSSPGRCWWSAPRTRGWTSPTSSPRPGRRSCAGRDCGQHPVPPGVAAGARDLAGGRVRVQARADPADPDGPQGDARGALPRRPALPGQAGGPGPPRRGPQPGPDDRGGRRAAAARPTAPSSTSPTSSGAPASGRSSTGSACRSWTSTAGRWSTAASSTRRPGCSSAACRSSTRSARWCSPASAGTPTTWPARSSPGRPP